MLVLSKTPRASYRSRSRGAGRYTRILSDGATCGTRVFCSIRPATVDGRPDRASGMESARCRYD
ncbi:hypothetical protein A8D95_30695 [Burkholderia cenocepacia]|uniref:Uncharacterized protein n=1 Tax=Burkholderia cenocepacia TaxID=95486 RepID=A0A1V2VQC0_9BURK|nr:hypothetical protein A8D61_00190 [Burkholderia cenocepacia]EPZ90195.1 hypothetical protein BURCENK562V_C2940 [Burkholderia cenocepacia K56-2Valvano]ERI28284.1 hypothetical protein BURCENBC7_AP3387 [Burkholderia cenocepacia BC7]AQQ38276.1 hypothetical protein A8E75_04360 [Burkholderia cenocepacia]AQQ46058.1 hypothetical protein A8F32_09330 [Burkholderia cenocepacia]